MAPAATPYADVEAPAAPVLLGDSSFTLTAVTVEDAAKAAYPGMLVLWGQRGDVMSPMAMIDPHRNSGGDNAWGPRYELTFSGHCDQSVTPTFPSQVTTGQPCVPSDEHSTLASASGAPGSDDQSFVTITLRCNAGQRKDVRSMCLPMSTVPNMIAEVPAPPSISIDSAPSSTVTDLPGPVPATAADRYATLEDMQAWARDRMLSCQPDQVINDGADGGDYLRRWFITPRSPHLNTYLHEILRSDDERAMHDHPWDNTSLIIAGSYREHTPHGVYVRGPGDFVMRNALDLHRLELIGGQPVISLFTTGPKYRDWGFHTPQGFVRWQDYHASASRQTDARLAA